MRIKDVRLDRLIGYFDAPVGFQAERLSRPLDMYPEHDAEPALTWATRVDDTNRHRIDHAYLRIETDEGVYGLAGPLERYEFAVVIGRQLRPLLMGEDPLAHERLWDKMYRLLVHGRKGLEMQAISAVDVALWDLKGRWNGAAVHRLLGGPTRTRLPVYASNLGYSIDPPQAAEIARAQRQEGLRAQKWFLRYGPARGEDGMRRNVETAQAVRAALGDDADLMLDAWMSWNLPYARVMAERLEAVHPRWIEEPLLPDLVHSTAELRRSMRIPLATGEHEYTRWGIFELLQAGAADVVQADTYWAGGITEMLKIGSVCSLYDVPLIPHGLSVPANVQLIASQPAGLYPMVEYLVQWNMVSQYFWTTPLHPTNGMVEVPDRPGIGVDIDEAKIAERIPLTWE
jgi:L-alanine-DL-glutamate epimerase-like enolase superfamily enzyme